MTPATGTVVCGDGSDGLRASQPFAPSLYAGLVENQLATQAEWDYLYSAREFDTKYTQSLLSYYMTGDAFELPGGTALAGLDSSCAMMRLTRFRTMWLETACSGVISPTVALLVRRRRTSLIGEIELPLLAARPGVEELTVNLSARYTKDEFYPGSWTYSAKLAYRPNNSLLLRSTVGTSYRAPNLRENFMLGQSGFRNSTFDPVCGSRGGL